MIMMDESRHPAIEGPVLDPAARAVRRTYPAEYRARVLAEYEAAPHGQKSAVLRREGIYQTLVAEWAKACLLYTSPSPRDKRQSRMPSSA